MDRDEQLARQLQARDWRCMSVARAQEAYAARAAMLRGGDAGPRQFRLQVEDAVRKALTYEDPRAQAAVLDAMPIQRLALAADEACQLSQAMGEVPVLGWEDALALQLLSWFKQDFFSWVNSPPCNACGSEGTRGEGVVRPTDQEAAHLASRTELYRCGRCGAVTRFPRYNDPRKLLETRRGRCGEWANAFTLICRAAGLEARLVVDWTDHVWTEYQSPSLGRWVHVDPSEAAHDKPLLYEAGWGKQLTYCVGVWRHGAADVSRRYSKDWAATAARRRLVREDWLESYLAEVCHRLRVSLPAAERAELARRDAAERSVMAGGASAEAVAAAAALPGRLMGSAEWRAARGETGAQPSSSAGSGSVAGEGPATRYALARDEGLAASRPGRLCGGAVRADADNPPHEAAATAFDGRLDTKWLAFGGGTEHWLEYRLPAAAVPVQLARYALTSANDSPERDPGDWTLEAWPEGASCWVALDEQRGVRFPSRHARLEFAVGAGVHSGPARRFRLRVRRVADPGAANSCQLAGLDLYQA